MLSDRCITMGQRIRELETPTDPTNLTVARALLLPEVLSGDKYIQVGSKYAERVQWRYQYLNPKADQFQQRSVWVWGPDANWKLGKFWPSQVNAPCVLVDPDPNPNPDPDPIS